MTPELEKAIEYYQSRITAFDSQLQLVLYAAKRVDALEKQQPDIQLMVEALDGGLQSLRHVVSALHAMNAISPDARMAINKMKEAISTPTAQQFIGKKKGK